MTAISPSAGPIQSNGANACRSRRRVFRRGRIVDTSCWVICLPRITAAVGDIVAPASAEPNRRGRGALGGLALGRRLLDRAEHLAWVAGDGGTDRLLDLGLRRRPCGAGRILHGLRQRLQERPEDRVG